MLYTDNIIFEKQIVIKQYYLESKNITNSTVIYQFTNKTNFTLVKYTFLYTMSNIREIT